MINKCLLPPPRLILGNKSAFTLIELSIVLVIIGLIIGGVLVGQDLINAATIRAQISQIEKYQTAVHTFELKYGYLPGDIPDPAASAFGFAQRATYGGGGDGNGVIGTSAVGSGAYALEAENLLFWEDLSKANLIEGSFSTANKNTILCFGGSLAINASLYFPKSKLGSNGYVYVWSGGWTASDGNNYFGVTGVVGCFNSNYVLSVPSITVGQAYSIDTKIDDGLPQSGNVTTMGGGWGMGWAVGGPLTTNTGVTSNWSWGDYGNGGGSITSATTSPQWADANGSTKDQLCYSNGDNVNVTETYNMKYPNNLNCALSFKFQ